MAASLLFRIVSMLTPRGGQVSQAAGLLGEKASRKPSLTPQKPISTLA